MDEAQFARELAKFRVVKRPEHVGPMQRKRTPPAGPKAAKTSVGAPAATGGGGGGATPSTASSTTASTSNATFWDLLAVYSRERMPEQDALKFAKMCQDLHEAGEGAIKAEVPAAAAAVSE